MDPYAAHFEKDHLGTEDFLRWYGPDVVTWFKIECFDVRETRDFKLKKNIPKPIVWLRGLDRPLFVNDSNHKELLRHFGSEYWLPLGRPSDTCWRENLGLRVSKNENNDGSANRAIPYRLEFVVPDPKAPRERERIPPERADGFRELLRLRGGSLDAFLRFVKFHGDDEMVNRLSSCSTVEEYPRFALGPMAAYAKTLTAQPAGEAPRARTHGSEPPASQRPPQPAGTDDDVPPQLASVQRDERGLPIPPDDGIPF